MVKYSVVGADQCVCPYNFALVSKRLLYPYSENAYSFVSSYSTNKTAGPRARFSIASPASLVLAVQARNEGPAGADSAMSQEADLGGGGHAVREVGGQIRGRSEEQIGCSRGLSGLG